MRRSLVGLLLLLAIHLGLLSWFAWTREFAFNRFDEPIYFGAGKVISDRGGEVAIKPTEYHPPLTYRMNSLFLTERDLPKEKITDWFEVSRQKDDTHFLHFVDSFGHDLLSYAHESGRSVGWLMFRGRVLFILLSVVVCVAGFAVLSTVSKFGAWIWAVAYALSPLNYELVPPIMTDFTFAGLALLSALGWMLWAKEGRHWALAGAALCLGAALGSKVSAVLLLPVALGAFLKRGRRSTVPFVVAMLSTGVVVWACYGFQVDTLKRVEKKHHTFAGFERDGIEPPPSEFARRFPRLYETSLPAVSFLSAVRWASHRVQSRQRVGIEGPLQFCETRSCYPLAVGLTYFPVSWWILVVVAGMAWIKNRKERPWDREPWVLAIFPLLYAAVSIRGEYQLGVRHFYPLYLFGLWIACSQTFRRGLWVAIGGLVVLEALFFLIARDKMNLGSFMIRAMFS